MPSQVYAGTGANIYALYGWESTYNTPVAQASRNKTFGRNVKLSTFSVESNFDTLYELYSRVPSLARYKQFKASVSIDAMLSNPWIFKALLGQVTDSGTGPYTHTFTRASTLPSITLEAGFALPGGNVVRTLSGGIVNQLKISGAVNDWIKLSGDIFFAQEQTVSTTLTSNATTDTMVPFTFSDAQLQLPSGGANVVAEVQTVDLTINNNPEPIYGLNSRYAQEVALKQFDVDIKLSATFKNATLLNNFLNMTSLSSAALVLNGTDGSSITFNLGTTYVENHGIRGFEPNAIVMEDVTLTAFDVTSIVAVNGVATTP